MKKRVLSLILAVVMVLGIAPIPSTAKDEVMGGETESVNLGHTLPMKDFLAATVENQEKDRVSENSKPRIVPYSFYDDGEFPNPDKDLSVDDVIRTQEETDLTFYIQGQVADYDLLPKNMTAYLYDFENKIIAYAEFPRDQLVLEHTSTVKFKKTAEWDDSYTGVVKLNVPFWARLDLHFVKGIQGNPDDNTMGLEFTQIQFPVITTQWFGKDKQRVESDIPSFMQLKTKTLSVGGNENIFLLKNQTLGNGKYVTLFDPMDLPLENPSIYVEGPAFNSNGEWVEDSKILVPVTLGNYEDPTNLEKREDWLDDTLYLSLYYKDILSGSDTFNGTEYFFDSSGYDTEVKKMVFREKLTVNFNSGEGNLPSGKDKSQKIPVNSKIDQYAGYGETISGNTELRPDFDDSEAQGGLPLREKRSISIPDPATDFVAPSGKTFAYWTTSEDGTGDKYAETADEAKGIKSISEYIFNDDTTFYAQYEGDQNAVNIQATGYPTIEGDQTVNGQAFKDPSKTSVLMNKDTVTWGEIKRDAASLVKPAPKGYTLSWGNDADDLTDQTILNPGDTITAKYIQNEVTLTVKPEDPATIEIDSKNNSITIPQYGKWGDTDEEGNTVQDRLEKLFTVNNGYELVGWKYNGKNLTDDTIFDRDADVIPYILPQILEPGKTPDSADAKYYTKVTFDAKDGLFDIDGKKTSQVDVYALPSAALEDVVASMDSVKPVNNKSGFIFTKWTENNADLVFETEDAKAVLVGDKARTIDANYADNNIVIPAEGETVPEGRVRITFDPTKDGSLGGTVYNLDKAGQVESYDILEKYQDKDTKEIKDTTWELALENGLNIPKAFNEDKAKVFDKWNEDLPVNTDLISNIGNKTYQAQYKGLVIPVDDPKSEVPEGYARITFNPGEDGSFGDAYAEADKGIAKTYDVLKSVTTIDKDGNENTKNVTWKEAIDAGLEIPKANYKDDSKVQDAWNPELPADDAAIADGEYTATYKENRIVIPDPEGDAPIDGYVRLTFTHGENGKLKMSDSDTATIDEKIYDVKKDSTWKTLTDSGMVVPVGFGNYGYSSYAWDPLLPNDNEQISENKTFTANFIGDLAKITVENDSYTDYKYSTQEGPTKTFDLDLNGEDKTNSLIDGAKDLVKVKNDSKQEVIGVKTTGSDSKWVDEDFANAITKDGATVKVVSIEKPQAKDDVTYTKGQDVTSVTAKDLLENGTTLKDVDGNAINDDTKITFKDGATLDTSSTGEKTVTVQVNYGPGPDGNDIIKEVPVSYIVGEEFTVKYDKGSVTDAEGTTLTPTGNVPADVKVKPNDTVKLSDKGDLELTDYTFTGWEVKTGDKAEIKQPGQTITITGDTTITAQWTKNDEIVTLTYKAGEIEGNPVTADMPEAENLVKDGKVTLKAFTGIEPEGYKFTGWKIGEVTYGPGATVTVNANTDAVAQWEKIKDTYTIKYEGGEGASGQGPSDQAVKQGETTVVQDQAGFTKEGFDFIGWKDQDGNDYNPGSTITPTGNVTLTAQWEATIVPLKDFKVSFDVGNTAETPEAEKATEVPDQTVKENSQVVEPKEPTKPGYTFKGWQDKDGNDYDFSTPVKEELTLKAVWEKNPEPAKEYTVTFDPAGGTPKPEDQKVIEGNKVIKPESPTKEGFTFDGWFEVSEDGTLAQTAFDFATAPTGDSRTIKLKAKWTEVKPDQVTLTYKSGADEVTENIPAQVTKNKGETVTVADSNMTREGYSFLYWKDEGEEGKEVFYNPGSQITLNDNRTLTGVWKETEKPLAKHTVTFDVDGDTTLVPAQTVTDGEKAIEPKSPEKAGFKFTGWKNGEEAYDFTKEVKGDLTLTAVFEQIPVTEQVKVTYTGGQGTSGENPADQIVAKGDKVVLRNQNTLTKEGNDFIGWVDAKGNKYNVGQEITLNEDLALTAEWKETEQPLAKHTVTFDVDGNTTLVPAQTVTDGEKAIEPKSPEKAGFKFTGWKNGEEAYDFKSEVKGDLTLTAAFEEIPVTEQVKVTYTGGQGTSGENPADQIVAKGDKVVLRNQNTLTKEGNDFIGWVDAQGNEYNVGQEITLTEDLALTANWKEKAKPIEKYTVSFDVDGDTTSIPSQTVNDGDKAIEPRSPEKDGFKFVEWQLDGEKYNFTEPVTSNITLKAVFEAVEEPTPDIIDITDKPDTPMPDGYHKVEFKAGEGVTIEPSNRVLQVKDGVTVPDSYFPTITVEEGYENGNWTPTKRTITEDTVYTANATEIAKTPDPDIIDITDKPDTPTPEGYHKVEFKAGEGVTIEPSNRVLQVKDGVTVPDSYFPTITVEEGYENGNWTPTKRTITEDTVYTANATEIAKTPDPDIIDITDKPDTPTPKGYHKVEFKAGKGVTIEPSNRVLQVKDGVTVPDSYFPTITVEEGYENGNWTPTKRTITEDTVYTANATEIAKTPDPDIIDITDKPDTPTPEGYHRVEFKAGKGVTIDPSNRVLQVKDGVTIPDSYFPTITVKSGYKNGNWTPTNRTITKDTIYTANAELIKDDPGHSGGTVTPSPKPKDDTDKPKDDERISGDDRIKTSVEVSKKFYDKADYVIIATRENYPDALTASMLGRNLKAPILLTETNTLPIEVAREIERLGAKDVIIVGGDRAVGFGVERALSAYDKDSVERLAGRDRYETSSKVARRVASIQGGAKNAVIASGLDFADALAAAPLAGKYDAPILLVKTNEIDKTVSDTIKDLGINKTYIVGGTRAVSRDLETKLPRNERYGGMNRYETANLIANKVDPRAKTVFLASGQDFPDALVIGPVAATKEMPIILTEKDRAPEASLTYFKTAGVEKFYIIGGDRVISNKTVDQFKMAN